MPESVVHTLHSEEETISLASRMAGKLVSGMVVGLSGDLGAGKSVFVRAAAAELGVTERMPSPTYTIVEEYPLHAFTVLHIDLYRLAGPDEFYLLGLEESFPRCISFIEWVDRVPELAESTDISIHFEVLHDNELTRRVSVTFRNGGTDGTGREASDG